MARLGELLTVAVLICSLHEAVSDSSSQSELYQKLRVLFEDKRVMQVADQVRRDMKEERSGDNRGEELLSQLTRLLTNSDKEQRDEREEEEAYERLRQREVDDGTPLKRLLMVLREWDITSQPWYKLKPDKSGYDTKCYIIKKAGYYEKIWPHECKYFIEKDSKLTKHCKTFCQDWIDAIKNANNGECQYDNKYTEKYCEDDIEKSGCSECKNTYGSTYSNCCGTCYRKCGK